MKKFLLFLILLLIGFVGWFVWQEYRQPAPAPQTDGAMLYDVGSVPDWSGEPTVEINGGVPDFAKKDLKAEFFQRFSELDSKGRCGVVMACVDEEHMPDGERGGIGMIKPSGWNISKYDFIDNGGYLFNRCHLIGWQLTGVNAEERNLITGTRYMNVEGMLPYENKVAWYVRSTGEHVLYRVTPVFHGRELVARGVQMEAQSVEDHGAGLSFNVYCYNVQPGVVIDYMTGDNHLDKSQESRSMPSEDASGEDADGEDVSGKKASGEDAFGEKAAGGDAEEAETMAAEDAPGSAAAEAAETADGKATDYILNTNTHRFHYPDCGSVKDMKEHNKEEYHGTRDELIQQGYQPCGNCKP